MEIEIPVAGSTALLYIPSGAVSQPTRVTVEAEPSAPPAPGQDVDGLSSVFRLTPEGVDFARPVLVAFPVNDANGDGLLDGTNIGISELAVHTHDEASASWTPLETVSFAHGYVTGVTTHFSLFSLLRRQQRIELPWKAAVAGVPFRQRLFGSSPTGCTWSLDSGPTGLVVTQSGVLFWLSPSEGVHTVQLACSGERPATYTVEVRVLPNDDFERLLPGTPVDASASGVPAGIDTIDEIAWAYAPLLRLSSSPAPTPCSDVFSVDLCGAGTAPGGDYWPISVEDALDQGTGTSLVVPGPPEVRTGSPTIVQVAASADPDAYIDFLGPGRPSRRSVWPFLPETRTRFESTILGTNPRPTMYWTAGSRELEGGFVQYWFFYPLNQWTNLHEGDWESVTVFFDLDWNPIRVAASTHYEGLRRCWSDVERLQGASGEHPVFYVSNGGHATYLQAGESDTRGGFVDSHIGDALVVVPDDAIQIPANYPSARLLVAEHVRPVPLNGMAEPDSWAAFRGGWGAATGALTSSGPSGPPYRLSGMMWHSPWSWASGAVRWELPGLLPGVGRVARDHAEGDSVPATVTSAVLLGGASSLRCVAGGNGTTLAYGRTQLVGLEYERTGRNRRFVSSPSATQNFLASVDQDGVLNWVVFLSAQVRDVARDTQGRLYLACAGIGTSAVRVADGEADVVLQLGTPIQKSFLLALDEDARAIRWIRRVTIEHDGIGGASSVSTNTSHVFFADANHGNGSIEGGANPDLEFQVPQGPPADFGVRCRSFLFTSDGDILWHRSIGGYNNNILPLSTSAADGEFVLATSIDFDGAEADGDSTQGTMLLPERGAALIAWNLAGARTWGTNVRGCVPVRVADRPSDGTVHVLVNSTTRPGANPAILVEGAFESLNAVEAPDAFLLTFSSSGTYIDAVRIGADGFQVAQDFAHLGDGSRVVVGIFRSELAGPNTLQHITSDSSQFQTPFVLLLDQSDQVALIDSVALALSHTFGEASICATDDGFTLCGSFTKQIRFRGCYDIDPVLAAPRGPNYTQGLIHRWTSLR